MKSIGILVSDISVRAGTERAVTNLSNILVRNGDYKVTIYSLFTTIKNRPSYEVENKVIVKHLGMKNGNKAVKLINYINLLKLLKREYNKGNIDYILGTVTAYNVLISYLQGVKRIGCEHTCYSNCTCIMNVARRIRYGILDRIVVLTDRDRGKYIFVASGKVKVIPNSLTIYRNERSDLTEKTIISIGRLEYEKGYDMLLEMASVLRKRLPDWKIVIYGEGNMRHEFEQMIAEKGLENYVFLQGQTDDVKDKLLKSSIYVMTSRAEGMGIVLIEAQACGLPVVAFDCESGPSEVINNGVDGYCVKDFNKKIFIKHIIDLAKDLNLRRKLGYAGYMSCERYNEKAIFAKWDKLFMKV